MTDQGGPFSAVLQWKGPTDIQFHQINSESLLHQVVCGQVCKNGGNCADDGFCRCLPGWTGNDCAISITSCGASSNSLQPGILTTFSSSYNYTSPILFQTRYSTLDVDWGYGSPDGSVPPDNINAHFSGYFKTTVTGWHDLQFSGDFDSSQGNLRIDHQHFIGPWAYTRAIWLVAGQYVRVDVNYWDYYGFANIHLLWRPPNAFLTPIPAEAWFSYPDDCSCPIDPATGVMCSAADRGSCGNGICGCSSTRSGTACENDLCRNDECVGTDMCYVPSKGSRVQDCGGHGTCVDGACVCDSGGWTEITDCVSTGCLGDGLCGMNGTCIGGKCVCDPGFTGLDCEVQQCASQRALRPGFAVEYRDATKIWYRWTIPNVNVDWSYYSPAPGMSFDGFTITWAGFVRSWRTGNHSFACVGSIADSCQIWLDGVLVSPLMNFSLIQNQNHRLKMEFVDSSGGPASAQFQWKLPSTSQFVIVPSENINHEIVCTLPCVNGCCVDDDTCRCFPGWTGHDCSISTTSCGGSASLVPGVNASYGNSPTLSPILFQQISPVLYFDWGYGSPSGSIGNDQINAHLSGYLLPNLTGWWDIMLEGDGGDVVSLRLDYVHFIGDGFFSKQIWLVAGQYVRVDLKYQDVGGPGPVLSCYFPCVSLSKLFVQPGLVCRGGLQMATISFQSRRRIGFTTRLNVLVQPIPLLERFALM